MRDGWIQSSLGELTEHTRPICYGVLKPGPQVDGGIPLVKITDMDRRILGPEGMQRISNELDGEFRRSRLKGGEVLLSIQGTVGRVAIAATTLEGANISRTIAVIDPDERLMNLYLLYVLEKIATEGEYDSAGSTRESLNISTIRNMKIWCPPLPEQKRIVDLISSVDSYIEALQKKLEGVKKSRNAVLHELLTTGGDDWTETTLGEIADWGSGGTPKADNPDFYSGDINWCVIGDLTESEVWETEKTITKLGLDKSSAKIIDPGCVLLAMYGASIGRTGISAIPMATNQAIAFAKCDINLVLPKYLLAYLQTQKEEFVEVGQGAAQPNISQTIIKSWKVVLPPISYQAESISIMNFFDVTIVGLRANIQSTKELRSSLLSDLLSGAHEIPSSYDKVMDVAG
jgi:type I restriction enzyme S subunit